MRRDRGTLAMMIGIPAIQLVMFGYAIQTEVRHLTTVVLDQSQSPESRRFGSAWSRGTSMSIGEGSGSGAGTEFVTMRGRDYPSIRQFTVFLENRVGQLLEVIRRFEGSKVRIVALSISDATECAFVRFLLSHPEQGREVLERAGLAIVESDLIGLELPEGDNPLLNVCTALLQAVARASVRHGCTRLEWVTAASNAKAIGFYERMGADVNHALRVCRLSEAAIASLAERRT